MADRIKSWSWSRYSLYKQCPFKAKLVLLDKLEEPKNSAMRRGVDAHDHLRDYLTGATARLQAEFKPIRSALDPLRQQVKQRVKLSITGQAPVVEEEWAFTASWQPTGWKDWSNCVLRIKLDVGWWPTQRLFRLRDWKTGKFSEQNSQEYQEQLELYALAALVWFPHAEQVGPDLYYVDHQLAYPKDEASVQIFTQADVKRLKQLWAKRTKALLADRQFSPRPGWYCQGCYFNKSTEYGWGKNKQQKPRVPCKF